MSARPGKAQASHLPLLLRGDTTWMEQANCVGLASDDFFPVHAQRINPAVRRICNTCPVQTDCLTWAITHHVWDGVWGGLSVEERKMIAKGHR